MLANQFDKFIVNLFNKKKQSVFIGILGKKQSGKTALALYILEVLLRENQFAGVGANLPIEAPFHIDFIEDFKTLEKICKMLNHNPAKHGLKRYLFFGSEMGKWLAKDTAWKNVDFIGKLQTVRKYGLSWIGDAIDRVDARALNPTHFEGCFHKLSPTNPTIAQYENWVTGEVTTIRNIPMTTLGFDTWYSANFYMEPQGEISEIHLDTDHKMILEYLEKGSWDKTEYSRKVGRDAIRRVLAVHMKEFMTDLKDTGSYKVTDG